MNAVEFVDAIRTEVRDAATQGVIALLEQPPGRRPSASLVTLSQWFANLSDEDKQCVCKIAAMASDQATFGILAVLDGVRVIEDGADRGTLDLRYLKDGKPTLLNDPNGPMLHELLRQE